MKNDSIKNKAMDAFITEITRLPYRHALHTPDLLYHYTSPSGLLGILDYMGIKFHFTRYDCVNDKTEGQDVLNCYHKACNELLDAREIDNAFYKLIYDLKVPKTNNFHYKNSEGVFLDHNPYEAYICCFSLEADSLPMWNYYVKDNKYQGYNIGVTSNIFQQYLDNDLEYEFHLVSVIYNEREKIESLKKTIKVYLDFFESEQSILDEKGLISFIEDYLYKIHLVFKCEYFAHEKEVRGIFFIPCNPPTHNSEFNKYFKKRNAYIIPYIEIIQKKKGYLDEITIGPLVEKELSQSTVKSLIEDRGYRNIQINNSEIPIRF